MNTGCNEVTQESRHALLLRETSRGGAVANPTIIVLFGGAGDLTWRELVPSLFYLFRQP
jgi:hypothetical protein